MRGLTAAVACLLPMWLAACQPAPPVERITVASLTPRVDASDPAHAMCQSFAPTPRDVSTFFRIATEVDGPAFHARSIILPCRVEGTLTLDDEVWRFSINAGSAGYLYKTNGTRRQYLCEQRCQKALAHVFGAE